MHILANKKGQTLVETVVALGILAIVLTGTISLVVNIVSLVLSSRNKTEAMALAEKGLAEAVAGVENGSIKFTTTQTSIVKFDNAKTALDGCAKVENGRNCNISIYTKDDARYDANEKDDKVYEIIATITWHDRVGDQNVVLKQLIVKPEKQ
jgi:type II secretory pathway pseudopilin PulG